MTTTETKDSKHKKEKDQPHLWKSLHGNADAFEIIQEAVNNPQRLNLVVTKDSASEERIFNALSFLAPPKLPLARYLNHSSLSTSRSFVYASVDLVWNFSS